MLKIGVAAAATVAAVSPAPAAIIYQETGTLTDRWRSEEVHVPLSPPGGNTIKVQFDLSSDDITVIGEFLYVVTVGNNEAHPMVRIEDVGPNARGFTHEIQSGSRYWGGSLFWESSVMKFDPVTLEVKPVTYSLTIWDSAVPEPASWAMMIAGFGLAGGAMRRRANVTAAHA